MMLNTRNNTSNNTISKKLEALIITLLLSYWIFSKLLQPISSFYKDYEAEILYFMNSLAVFKGGSYYYLDHPGTPVEILGSFILGLFYLFSGKSGDAFVQAQLLNPEPFFMVVHIVLTLASIFCALFLFNTVLLVAPQDRGDLLFAAAISLLYFAIHPLSFSTLTLWHHASFNFAFGTLYLVALFRLSQKNREVPLLTIIMLGLSAGVLAATMIYFVVWTVGAIIFVAVFYYIRKVSISKIIIVTCTLAGCSLLGFILSLLPAATRVSYFVNWITGLILHQGVYGGGASGVITLPGLWVNFRDMVFSLPAFSAFVFFVLILSIYALAKNRKRVSEMPGTWALSIALVVQVLVLLLLNLKHPGSKAFFVNRYLLPVAASVPVLTLTVIQLVKFSSVLQVWTKRVVILFVFVGSLYLLPKSMVDHHIKSEIITDSVKRSNQVIGDFSKEKKLPIEQVKVLWTYETFAKCYSLWFGNEMSGIVFSREVENICGQQNALNVWNFGAIVGDKFVDINTVEWDLVLTRKLLLSEYPHLAEMGRVYEYFQPSSDFDGYGSFIAIYNTAILR
jgi:hypothetical protein